MGSAFETGIGLINRIWSCFKWLVRRLLLIVPLILMAFVIMLMIKYPKFRTNRFRDRVFQKPTTTATATNVQQKLMDARNIFKEIYSTQVKYIRDWQSLKPWFMRGVQWPQHYDPHAKIFPEDAADDDRIVDQLMYTLPKDKVVSIKKILLANGRFLPDTPNGRTEFLRNKCPVDRCTLTTDKRQAATSDAILFKNHFTTLKHKRDSDQIWILYYLESPFHTFDNRAEDINWTATYRRDSEIVAPYEKWVFYNSKITERKLSKNYAANKTKKVAWFVSNCQPNNKRMEYAKKLSQYIRIDIYGACGNLTCPRYDLSCMQKLNEEYKFYLAFENSNCRDYITEKFFIKGLSHDVIPIVMGARPSEYSAVAPPNSFIHVDDFANPEELATYLHLIDDDDELYNSYFKWKGTGEFINTYFWCRVCAMLHASDQRNRMSHYSDVEAWWRQGTCTRGEWHDTNIITKKNSTFFRLN